MDRVRTLQAQHYDRSSGAADSNILDEVKKVMNILYHRLQPQFVPSMSYDGLQIRHIFMATIRDVTLKYIKLNSTSDQPNSGAHGTSGHPKNAGHGTSEHSVGPAHGTSGHPSSCAHGTSQNPTDAAHGTPVPVDALQVHNVQIEPAVALDVGSTMKNSVEHELVESRTEDISSKEKFAAQESSDSIQNAEMQTTASRSAGLMITGGQENDLGNMEGKQSSSDPQKEDSSGQLTTRTGAIAPTEMGDGTGHVGDGVEDRHLHKSVVEKSWRPQPPPPPLFDDDDDDDDDWLS